MKKNISNIKGKDLKWVVPNLVDLTKMGQVSTHGISTPGNPCVFGEGAAPSSCTPGFTAGGGDSNCVIGTPVLG